MLFIFLILFSISNLQASVFPFLAVVGTTYVYIVNRGKKTEDCKYSEAKKTIILLKKQRKQQDDVYAHTKAIYKKMLATVETKYEEMNTALAALENEILEAFPGLNEDVVVEPTDKKLAKEPILSIE